MNWYRIAAFGWLLTMVSCGLFGGEKEDDEKPDSVAAPRLVGRIASINEAQRFVLIEGYEDWVLGEDLLLSSFGEGSKRSATLTVSGERMGRFAAADWKSGEIEVGDQVFARQKRVEEEAAENGNSGQMGAQAGDSSRNFDKNASGTN